MMQRKGKEMAIGSLLFTLIYIIAELTFNLGLVDFLNSKNTEMDTFKQLETFGRVLSSVGFALLIVKFVLIINSKWAMNASVLMIKIVTFIIACTSFYTAQTIIFNKILDSMSNKQSLNAYAFGVYRNLNLNNQVTLKILKGEDKDYDHVINSMLGVLATNSKIEKDVEGTVKKFFHAENNLDQNLIGTIYDEIQVTMPNFDKYWGIYAIESRRYENYAGPRKGAYKKKFEEQVGIAPGLNKNQFEAAMKRKLSPNKSVLNSIVIVPANKSLNMNRLTVGDIPDGLSKQKWINYVNNHVNSALEKGKFKDENVHSLPHSREIISSVVITPFAILISMIALFLNLCTLVTGVFAFIGRLALIPGALMLCAILWFINDWTYNPYGLNETLNKLIGAETKMTKMFAGYTKIIHELSINDKNPNKYQIIRLEKPKMPDMSKMKKDLDEKFKNLKNTGDLEDNKQMKALSETAQDVKVDLEQLEKNKNYYGEINKKNPYGK